MTDSLEYVKLDSEYVSQDVSQTFDCGIPMKKLKRKDISINDVMQKVAEKNGYKYVPPEKRTPKKLVYSKSITGETLVSLVDAEPKKLGRRKIKKKRNVQKYWQMIHRKISKICCIILICSI